MAEKLGALDAELCCSGEGRRFLDGRGPESGLIASGSVASLIASTGLFLALVSNLRIWDQKKLPILTSFEHEVHALEQALRRRLRERPPSLPPCCPVKPLALPVAPPEFAAFCLLEKWLR